MTFYSLIDFIDYTLSVKRIIMTICRREKSLSELNKAEMISLDKTVKNATIVSNYSLAVRVHN